MTETSLKTKLCSQCGFGNPAVAKFCSECGERFVVTKSPDTTLESSIRSLARPDAAAPRPLDPRAALEQFVASLATEDATSRLRSSIESSRAQLKTLGVPLPKATNPLLVSLMESLKALPHTETSARIAIVTALGRTGDPAVLPPLLLVTGAQSKDVRKATAIALACIRHPLSAYLLLPMLQDGSSRVRHAAFQALIQLNQPHSMDAILAACLCGNVFRSLILETLRLVSDVKRRTFFELLGDADANQTPELRSVADWLRFEFKNAITESSPVQTANTAAAARQPTPAAIPQKARPQEKKPVRQPVAVAADSQSSESSVFGWGSADKSQSTPASGAASDYRYSTRTTAAVAKESQTTDHYEMTPDFADDDEYESDVRLLDSSDSSRSEDMSFFNAISDSLTDDSADHEDDGNDRSELESGSHDSPGWAYDRGQNTATLMGTTPGLSMPMLHPPEMKANGMQRGMMLPPAFDMTASSPLIPAFTNATSQSSVVTATTYGHAQAGSDASSTSHRSSSASAATHVVLLPDEDPGDDGIAAATARAAAHEKAIARLSAAREEAFRKLLDDAEEIPKVLPRLLKRRVSRLMSTPSIKTDEVAEQIRGLGATNSSAALSVLASFSQKPAKQIREACAEALGGIVHSGSAVLLLKLLTDKSGTVVEAAIRALTQIDLEPIRPVLIAAGLCGTSLRTVVTVGVESASDDKKPEWEKFLLEVLRADDPDAAAFAISLLSRIAGDTHLEIFQNLASHKTGILRAAAVDALSRTQAKRAISQINDALEDADPSVRAQAAMSVATMYSPRSLELLRKLVSDGNLSVRRNAAQTMSRIDETDLAETIARALDQETDTTTVEYLLAALQRNGGNSSLPILQRYIEGEASQFREQAVKALRKLKIPASVPIFRRLLDDHTPALRRQSVEQLAVLKSENVLPRLREMLKQDPDETVRGACAKAVGDFGDKMSLHILEEALEDRASVRLQAVIALGRLGQASAGPIMLSLLRDSLPEIRYQAVRSGTAETGRRGRPNCSVAGRSG